MKKIITIVAVAMLATTVWAEDKVLDISSATVPDYAFTFNEFGAWDSTYAETMPYLEFPPFLVSHITFGSSYGGYFWDGFTVCRSGDNAEHAGEQLTYQWNVMPGGGIQSVGADGSVVVNADVPYLLSYNSYSWYGPMDNQVIFNDNNAYYAKGMYVTNSCYGYYACKNGAAPARAFNVEGDSFKLIAHGVNYTTEDTATVEIELAGFHDGVFSGLTEWTWWDLSALGQVDEIFFSMTSTDVGTYGINTPTYFAIDRLTVSTHPSAVETVETTKQVAGVSYVNLTGQQSSEPFQGVNVVVTRYTDGSTSTAKVMK